MVRKTLDNIYSFINEAIEFNNNVDHMTRIFFKSLIGNALLWYQELLNDSIQSFENFIDIVLQEYKLNIKCDTILGHLYKVK